MPRGGKRMPSYRDIAETMDGDELDAILDVSLQGLARAREKGSQPMYSNSPEGLKSFKHDSEEYLTFVRNANKTPTEGGKLRLVPDIESWAAFLGVTRYMITGYERRSSDWKSTIDAVKGVITACKKQLAFTGKMPPVLAIFDLTNNSDYVNASEFRLSAEAAPEAKQITAEEWEKVKGILGIIASPINEVAVWLTKKILANQKNGAYFHYGGTLRILKRLILSPSQKNKA